MNIDVEALQEHWNRMLPLTFEVKLAGKKQKLVCDVPKQILTITNSKKKGTESLTANQILNVSRESPKELLLRWVREKAEVEEKVSFNTAADCQRFVESCTVMCAKGTDSLRDLSEQITIMAITWNMGDTAPPESLKSLLKRKINGSKFRPTIYAFSTQECSHSPPSGEGKSTSRHVRKIIQNTLGSDYIPLVKKSLSTIRLFLFVRQDAANKITQLETAKEACGIAHVIGNKGAVAASFKYNETSFCFVSSHLAAHQEKVEDRNADFVEILKGLSMGKNHFSVDSQFNHVFWMGDLNYRIDLSRERVVELVEKKDWEKLRAADQLINERKNANVFMYWREGEINFRPTYRYLRGTNDYDPELGRIPSWCDRVMFKSLPIDEAYIRQLAYGADDKIVTSDHHPVYAAFEVNTLCNNVLHPKRNLEIQITNLHGDDLVAKDRSGKSDPFIRFNGVFMEGDVKTKVIKQNLNPVWKNEDVPLIIPFISNNYLERCYIHFVVQDWDFASGADNMGQGVIPLANVYSSTKPVPFTSRVTLQGSPAGSISGHIQIIDKE